MSEFHASASMLKPNRQTFESALCPNVKGEMGINPTDIIFVLCKLFNNSRVSVAAQGYKYFRFVGLCG